MRGKQVPLHAENTELPGRGTVRVLRIINRFNLGGITYNVSYLSRYMHHDFTTMLIGGPEGASEASSLHIPRSLGLEPIIIPEMKRSVNPLKDLMAYLRVRRIIRRYRPHIVHTHASKAGAIGRLAAYHSGVPVIVHTFHGHVFRGYFGTMITGLYKTAERLLASRSDAVIAISALQKNELTETHRICEQDKIRVINLGFDLTRFATDQDKKRETFRHELGLQAEEIVVGIIGRLAPIKNHSLFVKAASHCIRNSGRKVRAVIIGGGETKPKIMGEIRKQGLIDSETGDKRGDFIFTGWRNDADVVLAGLDIVCLTSDNEGTPVSLIEAQAASRFVVTTDVGGVRDILHPGCGLLSEAGDEKKYSENLMKAVKDFETLSARAGAASAHVLERFSYRRLCDDTERLYRELIEKKNITV